ncbi:hypothetical protein D1841_02830 [Neglecta sp. X4]|nr:hypothetical protein [Neglectibacter sp. 59]NBJ72284.1 hypothetical protein [Neglectibacter sp. X4]
MRRTATFAIIIATRSGSAQKAGKTALCPRYRPFLWFLDCMKLYHISGGIASGLGSGRLLSGRIFPLQMVFFVVY